MTGMPFAAPIMRRLRFARAALLWEVAWPAFAPAFGVIGLFFVLALFDLLPLLPAPLHAFLLFALGALLAFALFRAARRLVIPGENAARRRIESRSGLLHRPLEALADRPLGPLDALSKELWEAHRRRMAAAVGRLRVGWPEASLARTDPWALRALLALLLLVGAVDAGSAWRERVLHALTPNFSIPPPAIPPTLDIWVTPPRYTGLPPRFLQPGEKGVIRVPAGSKLLAEVHGGGALPHLAIDEERRAFVAIDKENFRAQAKLVKGRTIAVNEGGRLLGRWHIRILPDLPPKIAFARPPQATPGGTLRIDYGASDDYGVRSVEAAIRRSKGEAAIRLPLPISGSDEKSVKATRYVDLTASPWAGLAVQMRLVAKDALGQEGKSRSVRMTLPERAFRNPVARQIIALRKKLVADPRSRASVAKALGALNKEPRLYHDDGLVFLSLGVAAEDLRASAAATSEVVGLLWQVALRIEDGRVPLAQSRLRQIEQKLNKALAGNARAEEIDRLMRQLEQALRDYFAAMAQNLAKQPQSAPLDAPRLVGSRDLERLIERARELAANGDREAARQLLAQLENMLENLRMLTPAEQQALAKEEATMRDMRQLMRSQRRLLDQSFRASREAQGKPGEEGQTASAAATVRQAREQEALAARLAQMMSRLEQSLGRLPSPFGRAEEAMRAAASVLRAREPGQAIGPQKEALGALREASRRLAQAMARALGKTPSGAGRIGFGRRGQGGPGERDPFGREIPGYGTYDQSDVKIPPRARINEAHKILEELRQRAGEPWRSPLEHHYIDRLLDQF
jgi:uncharacterized protein (TIGR02302 family)